MSLTLTVMVVCAQMGQVLRTAPTRPLIRRLLGASCRWRPLPASLGHLGAQFGDHDLRPDAITRFESPPDRNETTANELRMRATKLGFVAAHWQDGRRLHGTMVSPLLRDVCVAHAVWLCRGSRC